MKNKKDNLDYKQMIMDIEKVIDTEPDFLMDMECKEFPEKFKMDKYTQEEAKKMSEMLGNVFLISHCLWCRSCAGKYLKGI